MIIAATGHRPNKLGGYGEGVSRKVFTVAYEALTSTMPDKVITGMAIGWDTAIGLAAVELGIPLIAAVPFEGQERTWPKEAQAVYTQLLSKADKVVFVNTGGYESWKMQARNEWMVFWADKMVALWDGSNGGTANCARYALALGKPVENWWSRFMGVKK